MLNSAFYDLFLSVNYLYSPLKNSYFFGPKCETENNIIFGMTYS